MKKFFFDFYKAVLFTFLLLIFSNCQLAPPQADTKASVRGVASLLCDVKDFGAKGDGKTKDTAAIQAAIDHCAGSEGTVLLHDGVFLSGQIHMKNRIEFKIEPTATLKGSMDDQDYPNVNPPTQNTQLRDCKKAFIYAESVEGLIIDGGGTIDGSGGNLRWTGKEYTRPIAVFLALSTNVKIQNVTVKDSGMWGVVIFETNNVKINALTVHSLFHPNRDGIDIVDSHHVLIDGSTISADDDGICLKSGSAKGVFDVTVRNTKILHSNANGLKLGTASVGSFKKILFENIQLQDVGEAAMAVESVDGAQIDDVQFRNIQFQNVGTAFFVLLGRRLLSFNVGTIQNISFTNITGTTHLNWGSVISGTRGIFQTYAIKNVHFTDVHIKNTVATSGVPGEPSEYNGQYPDPNIWNDLPSHGIYLRHVDGVNFTRSSFQPAPGDPRPEMFQSDTKNFLRQ